MYLFGNGLGEVTMGYDIIGGNLVRRITFFTLPSLVVGLSVAALLLSIASISINLVNGFDVWPYMYAVLFASIIPLVMRSSIYIDIYHYEVYLGFTLLGFMTKRTKLDYYGTKLGVELTRDNKAANWKLFVISKTTNARSLVLETIDKRKANKILLMLDSNII